MRGITDLIGVLSTHNRELEGAEGEGWAVKRRRGLYKGFHRSVHGGRSMKLTAISDRALDPPRLGRSRLNLTKLYIKLVRRVYTRNFHNDQHGSQSYRGAYNENRTLTACLHQDIAYRPHRWVVSFRRRQEPSSGQPRGGFAGRNQPSPS